MRRAFVEVVMILLVGMLWGLYNPNQVAEPLGISPKRLYERLKELSARQWRRLLDQMMLQAALERLRKYQAASAATQSRQQASLSIDDTVVKRLGSVLSSVWCWYSGQAKKVVQGQDLVGIVLRIGGEIIPLRLVWVSKQGRRSTSKPEVVLQAMAEVKAWFAQRGVDLTALGGSFDSWWVSEGFSRALQDLGFNKQVICGKGHLVLETEQGRRSWRAHRAEVELGDGWGHHQPAHRLRGHSPTFGAVVVVLFHHPRSKAFGLLCPVRPLRTCEALRLWANHHAVETFWKRLKRWLGLGQRQLRGRAGAWAELALRGLAYLLALPLLDLVAPTLAQLTHWVRRQGTFADLVNEHFQLDLSGVS